jgi:hypothetical protein
VPRVTPRKPRFAEREVVRAWQGVAVDVDGIGYTVERGTKLRGDHVVVRHAPWAFVADTATSDEEPSIYARYAEEPKPPLFSEPTKIKFVPHFTASSLVLIGARSYAVGETATVDPVTAQRLIEDGYAVVA